MTGRLAVGIGLILFGSLFAGPIIVILGLAVVLFEGLRLLWARRGLHALHYERRLPVDRVVCGDAIPLEVVVWNHKRLPLSWVRVDDETSPGVGGRDRELVARDDGRALLRNTWTLAPFERVIRHFNLIADRRGVFTLGPATVEVGDLFAGQAGAREDPGVARYVVRPRSVPVRGVGPRHRWGGPDRARRGLIDNPAFYAGLREYRPGDPIRRIHPRASARLGRPLTKRFDPAREREVLIALDIQTLEGPSWQVSYLDDLVEELCVVAASMARALRSERAAFGLAVAGYTGTARTVAFLGPSESPGQLERVLDLLARLSSFASAPFQTLLGRLPRSLRPGTAIVVLTSRDPGPWLAVLRRIERMGYPVTVVGYGPIAPQIAARARAAGLAARVAQLNGPWRTATGLVVA